MEKFKRVLAGRSFAFEQLQDGYDRLYEIRVGGLTFKTVGVEERYRIVNPDSLPAWIVSLEYQLSEAICQGKQVAG